MKFSLVDVQRYHLDNGMTVLIRPDSTVPIVTTMIWYKVGSRYEKQGRTGLSHFIEHMMFKGTKHLGKGAIDHITTKNGGYNNAFTAYDYTAYFFTFASDRWHKALEIEADRMINTVFEHHEFELERQVILEEIHMSQDDPWDWMRQKVDCAAFPDHPYGRQILGTAQDLQSITPSHLQDFYHQYYLPNNSTFVVVGDVNPDNVLEMIDNVFGPLKPGKEVAHPKHGVSRPKSISRIFLKRPSKTRRLLIATPAPSGSSEDLAPMHLIDRILSEGRLSRLYRRFVDEEQVASLVSTELEETAEPFVLSTQMELENDANPVQVEAEVLEEFDRITRDPVQEEELERAKNQCTVQLLGELETTFDQAFQIGLMETIDKWENLNLYISNISEATPASVQETAKRYFDPNQTVICHFDPES